MYRFSNDEPIIVQAGISYQLRTHKCTAEICSSSEAQGDIFIPKSIEHENQEYTITFIGSDAFKNNRNIKAVSIAEDSIIREIRDSAFKESSITKITIPSSVNALGYKCFDQCENLESVEFFPNSQLSSIGYRCFAETAIKTIKIPTRVTVIDKETFSECKNLKTIEIPPDSELSAIFRYAFSDTQIESLTIPQKLNLLDDGWCDKTPKLNRLIMPHKSSYLMLKNDKLLIGKSDNDGDDFDLLHFACRDINGDVTIPSTVKQIGYFSFEDCMLINSIRFEPESQLEQIKVGAFYSSMVNKIDLPSSVIEIERECFFNCLNLSEISIPSSVTKIGTSCFCMRTNLKKVNFSPDSKITAIESRMFYGSGIECISIPPTVTVIGPCAFYNCKRLKSIQIPSESNLESIENDAFASASIESLFIPSKLEKLGEMWCDSTTNLSTISISPENKIFTEINDQIIIGKSNKANQFFDNFVFAVRTIEYLTVPSRITTLCKSCLSGCNKLKSVTFLPDSMLTTIEEGAFAPSSLLYLTLPPSYKKVTNGALDKCENFVSIELLADSVEIEASSFSMAPNLLIASAPNAKEFKFKDHNLGEEFTVFVLANSIVDSQPDESKCIIS